MSTDGGVVRRAAQLVALADRLRQDLLGSTGETPSPISWPTVTPEETVGEWNELRGWVERLRARFPSGFRLPDCWWQHNDLVEVLSALRDFERACFAASSPATAPVEWQRALRDMEARMEMWTRRFTCGIPGRGHDVLNPTDAVPPGWTDFVDRDLERRRRDQERSADLPGG